MGKFKKGFTLIELLVVIGIIVLLAGIVMPNFMKHIDSAKKIRARADINSLESALAMYQMDYGIYPGQWAGSSLRDENNDYIDDLKTMLQDPGTEGRGLYLSKDIPPDPYGENYRYRAPGTSSSTGYLNPLRYRGYDLWSYGKNKTNDSGGDDDITSWDTETN